MAARGSVERQISLLILFLGVLPLGLISVLALEEIRGQTLALAGKQLRESTKTYALEVFDQLDHAAWEMRIEVASVPHTSDRDLLEDLRIRPAARPLERPRLRLESGELILSLTAGAQQLDGVIDVDRLLSGLGHVPAGVDRCVRFAGMLNRCAGHLQDSEVRAGVIEASWTPPLTSVFETDLSLVVTARQSRESALKHVDLFSKLLPLGLLLVIFLIGWMLIAAIRRRMAPLSDLEAATVAIRQGDYGRVVDIHTGDEFERLGQAFNVMSRKLEQSFSKMEGLAEIDRSILDGSTVEEVIRQALRVACSCCGRPAFAVRWDDTGGRLFSLQDSQLDIQPIEILGAADGEGQIAQLSSVLRCAHGVTVDRWAPVRVNGEVAGALLLAMGPERETEHSDAIEELADRISVAATNDARAKSLYLQANYDGLTGLANRQAFADRLAAEIRRAARTRVHGAVLFLDLDRFKQVNDTQGHAKGDELLREVAARLTGAMRETDTVARLGGDEFAVMVPDCGSSSDLKLFCERLIDAVSRPIEVNGIRHQIDVSIGVSLFPQDGTDVGTLLRKADMAMYVSKGRSGSAFSFYDGQLDQANERRVLIESRLREAMEAGRLVLHYQPKLDLGSRRIRGAEGLMRWEDPAGAGYGPQEFIPVAEETGLIHRFTEVLVAEAVRALDRCRSEGVVPGRISLNISTRQIIQPGFARSFLEVLHRRQLDPDAVEIEVTETVFVESAELVTCELNTLRAAGVTVALDDFGTGYSSLNMLRALPLDTLKIDRSFIVPLLGNEDARQITRKIIEMASTLNLEVVAEGVEHQEEVALLERMGCHAIQGYLVSRPLDLEAYVHFLKGSGGPGTLAGIPAAGAIARAS